MTRRSKKQIPYSRRQRHRPSLESLEHRQLLAGDVMGPGVQSANMLANSVDGAAGLVAGDVAFADIQFSVDTLRTDHTLDIFAAIPMPRAYGGPRIITSLTPTQAGSGIEIDRTGKSVRFSIVESVHSDSFSYVIDGLYRGTAHVRVLRPLVPDHYEVIRNSPELPMPLIANDFLPHQGDSPWGVVSATEGAAVKANARITELIGADTRDFEISDDGQTVYFTAHSGAPGLREFRYVVNDRYEQIASVMVHQGVLDDQFDLDSNAGVETLDVLANDRYVSRFGAGSVPSVQQITSVTQGDHGGLVEVGLQGKSLQYTPPEGFRGTETFQYVADDRYTANVVIRLGSPAGDDSEQIYLGAESIIDVLSNDFLSGPPGTDVVTSVSASDFGAVISIEDNKIRYEVPDNAAVGQTDQFTYTVNGQHTATVSVAFLSPTTPDNLSVARKTEHIVDVLANDRFDHRYTGQRMITDVSMPTAGGELTISSDSTKLIYTPGAQHETFTYTVDDRFTETVNVRPEPHLRNDTLFVAQNEPEWFIDVLANDFATAPYGAPDAYDGPKDLILVGDSSHGGSLSVTDDRMIRYVPPTDFVGADSFVYRVDELLTATVNVQVYRGTSDDSFSVPADSQNSPLQVLANDLLGFHYSGPGVITEIVDVPSSIASISSDGRSLTYSAPRGFTGQHEFQYVVDDQFKAMVTVSVGQTPEQPTSRFESLRQLQDYVSEESYKDYQSVFGTEIPAIASPTRRFVLCDTSSNVFAPRFNPYHFIHSRESDSSDNDAAMVQSDGEYIYTLREGVLTIVQKMADGALNVVSQTAVAGRPREMFLDGDRITIVALTEPGEITRDVCGMVKSVVPSHTTVSVYDVAHHEHPALIQRTILEGRISESKRAGDSIAFVLDAPWVSLEPEVRCDDEARCRYESVEEFNQRLNANFAATIETRIPGFQSFDRHGRLLRSGRLLGYEDLLLHSNDSLDADTIKVIVTLNPQSNEPGLRGAAGMFANQDTNVFLADESVYLFQGSGAEDSPTRTTQIQKLRWTDDATVLLPTASGNIPGIVPNRSSVAEHAGQLRVASQNLTPIQGTNDLNSEVSMFVLHEAAGTLDVVGFVGGILPNKSYSRLHLDDDNVYIIPDDFAEPLVVIDLADPRSPQRLGEMNLVDGISYMQFLSQDRLITVSQRQFQFPTYPAILSLFDISDPANPVLVGQTVSGYFGGIGEENHAFGWNEEANVFVAPLGRSDERTIDMDSDGVAESQRWFGSKRLAVYHVNVSPEPHDDVFTRAGIVEHDDFLQQSLFVGETLYSIGLDGIRSVALDGESFQTLSVDFGDRPGFDTVERESIDEDPLATEARTWLGQQRGVAAAELSLVAVEHRGRTVEMVFRNGANHYRVSANSSGAPGFIESAFQFSDNPYHNALMPMDVNGDRKITPVDALAVINQLSRGSIEDVSDRALHQIFPASGGYLDVNNDGYITPSDVLMIINDLARSRVMSGSSGEWINPLATDRHDGIDAESELPALF